MEILAKDLHFLPNLSNFGKKTSDFGNYDENKQLIFLQCRIFNKSKKFQNQKEFIYKYGFHREILENESFSKDFKDLYMFSRFLMM